MNTQDFISTINKLRLSSKNNWYAWEGTVNNKTVQLKGYNTYIQICIVNGKHCSDRLNLNVKHFKENLKRFVS